MFDAAPGYLSADDCRLADLIDLVSRKTDLADYPYAGTVEQNVLIHDGGRLRKQPSRPACQPRVETELARALLDGPGIVVLAGAFDDPWVIDRAARQFEAIIAAQAAAGGAAGAELPAGLPGLAHAGVKRRRRPGGTPTPRRRSADDQLR